MQTEDATTDQREEKAKIWAELEASEATGAAMPSSEEPVQAEQQTEAQDAPQAGAEPAAEEAGGASDPFSGWPEPAKNEVIGLRTIVEQLVTRVRNAEGHIGGLNSQLKQQLQRAQQVREGGGDAPTASQIREAQGDPASMKKLIEDYPEFGGAMKSALDATLSARFDALRAELTAQRQPSQDIESVVTKDVFEQKLSELRIESAHPGWQERVRTPSFAGWLQQQPREVKALADSPNAEDAIRLLDLHSATTKQAVQTRTQRQSAAAAIPVGRTSAVRAKPIEQMTKAEYWAYLDAQEAQKG